MTTIFNNIPLGVQSYCFRKFTNDKIPDMLKFCGLNTLEICKVHLDVLEDPQQGATILDYYQKQGIQFNSYGINPFGSDEASARKMFEFAKRVGISTLGANPAKDAYPLLQWLCQEYDVKLAIHNHGSQDKHYGTLEQLREALDKSNEYIGLCLDTGWLLDSGIDPVEAVLEFGDRIYGVHFKDFSFNENERQEAVLGEGMLDLQAVVNALKKVDFQGYATIEYEGEPDQPTENIKRCVDALVKADRTA